MSEPKFGSWSVAESANTIEYSLVVIEEIRHEVAEGFQRLSRGGIEVGGVLYGTQDGNTVRITAMRPIACEHARGPAFLFSDKDRIELHRQLREEQQDPHLQGLVTVGWFLSHTRTEVALTESDQEIYSIFFPAPWQVTLVIHPVRGGGMRAGFFVREADGTVKSEHSHLEFNLPERLAGMLPVERPPRDRWSAGDRRPSALARSEAPAMAPDRWPSPAPDLPPMTAPQLLATPRPHRRWLWLVAWAIVVLVASVFGLRYLMMHTGTDPISLSIIEREGQLQIGWNHTAKSILNANRGNLDIVDGPDARTIALTPRVLAGGRIFYERKTGDVDIRMTVEDAGGRKVQEASRFLGLPLVSVKSEEITSLRKRRDELEAEVKDLRQQNGAQSSRIQQLERTLRILETRLSIDQGRQP